LTPDQLARSKSEHAEQRALFAWANMAANFGFVAANDDRSYSVKGHAASLSGARVEALDRLFAIPNGGPRDKITAGKLKAEGVKKGVPDVLLPLPIGRWAGLFIELKRMKTDTQRAGTTSDDQDDWTGYLRGVGYGVAVAFGWREAAKQLQSYIEWKGNE
jgi:hypothetical protein